MKTRSAAIEPPNIAAGVKARRMARITSPFYRSSDSQILPAQPANEINENKAPPTLNTPGQVPVSSINTDKPESNEQPAKGRQTSGPKFLKDSWTADDRRLFFQGIRLYGRNFTELTRFIRSRGHRGTSGCDTLLTSNCAQPGVVDSLSMPIAGAHNLQNMANAPPSTAGCSLAPPGGQPSSLPSALPGAPAFPLQDLNAAAGGRTRDQVRLFYQQTWHKLRRYIKYPDGVPQHVREVYALVNWSIMRSRIKKALDNRLGEKLNELVHYGSTCVKHNGRRFLLRTPVCPALKQINKISAPAQEFTLPEDVWIELVPASQIVAWRVLEAEQNPRLRLRVDINRQLSDVISLVEAKWMYPVERIRSLLELSCEQQPNDGGGGGGGCIGRPKMDDFAKDHLLLRFPNDQKLEGAIGLQEVSRTRSADISLTAYQARRLEAINAVGPREESEDGSRPSPAVPKVAALGSGPPEVTPDGDNVKEAVHAESPTVRHEMEDCNAEQAAVKPQESGPRPTQTSAHPPAAAMCSNYTLPSVNPVVHLDLRSDASRLMTGVTFEEARSMKLLVIYLALGCPARIRFEYDFVHLSTVNGKTLVKNSQQGIAIADGISNGLRRLLHLNASDYLNFKDWTRNHNQMSARPTTSTKNRLAPNSITLTERTPPEEQPQVPQSSLYASHQTENQLHPPLLSSGHEAVVVGQTTKVVVARQLNVCGPEPGSAQTTVHPTTTSINNTTATCVADGGGHVLVSASPHQNAASVIITAAAAPLPSQVRPALPCAPLPGLVAIAPAPQSSLGALRAFNQSQARCSRTARSRCHLSSQTVRRGRPPPPVAPLSAPQTAAAGMPVATTTPCEGDNRVSLPSRPGGETVHTTNTTLTAIQTTASPALAATTAASIAAPVLSTFAAAVLAPSVRVNYTLDTTTDPYKIEANQAGINSPVSTTPSTTTAIDAMRLNQSTLDSLPQPDCGPLLSLDGYTNQSSTSDTMKSLLNAIMRTVPPVTSSSEEVRDQHSTEQPSNQEQNQREQEQPHDFNSLCHLDLMYPSPAAGNASIPFPVVLGTPENTQPAGPPDFQFSGSSPVSYSLLLNEDSSSLGAVITGLSRRSGTETLQPAGGEISLSDSLACKILMEMSRSAADNILFTTNVKPATTDGAILTDRSDVLAPESDAGFHPDWFSQSLLPSSRSGQEGDSRSESAHLVTPIRASPAQSALPSTEASKAADSVLPSSFAISSDQVSWDNSFPHVSTSKPQ